MSHYKAYAACKASGVEWLGQVPENWSVTPFKWLADIRNGKDYKDVEAEDSGFPVIGSGGEFARASQYLFNGESVLLGRKGTIDRPLYINGPFWTVDTMFYTVIGPNAVAKYLYYCSLTIQFDRYSTNTALPSMTQEVLGQILFAVPEIREQCAIVSHLDCETARIDGLVSKKTRFIELLREKRQALITHAVTKGLDPNVKMKDSGVEWLGDVPEHWGVKRIKYVKAKTNNAFVDGPFGSNLKSEHFVDGGDVYVIESNFATQGKLISEELKTITSEHFQTICRSEASEGDIIIAKIGAQFGKAAILPKLDKRSVVSGNSLKLTLNEKICLREWAFWQLINLKNNGAIDDLAKGGAQPALSLGEMNDLPILTPSLLEQQEVIAHIERETTRFDRLVNQTERSIELLKERRSALITAAVTGQIDLREALSSKLHDFAL